MNKTTTYISDRILSVTNILTTNECNELIKNTEEKVIMFLHHLVEVMVKHLEQVRVLVNFM